MPLNTGTSWKGSSNESPPHNYQQVAADGRFWWTAPPGSPLGADGDIIYIAGDGIPTVFNINWQVTVPAEGATQIGLVVNGVTTNIGPGVGSGTVVATGPFSSLDIGIRTGAPYSTYYAVVAISFSLPAATPIGGQGDITNPGAWEDPEGNIPPLAFQNVPQTVNFPLNGDGRYWFVASATVPNPDAITFIGDPLFKVAGTMSLQSTITQAATDGSTLFMAYSLNGGTSYTSQQIGPSLQGHSLLSAQLNTALAGTTTLMVKVYSTGGTASPTAKPWNVALAITRNPDERIAWDYPNPYDPVSYNAECMDEVVPTETLLQLRTDIAIELGFASQSANLPPSMALLINSWLTRNQKFLYRRYSQLHTRRMFRWKVNPGQRFYSLKDNDEDVLCNYTMDPLKTIEWAGIQDSRNVWYPLDEGIDPSLYTMIDKPWRPARYEIRQAIEIYPAPDRTYWLWMKAHFGLRTFVADGDLSTIDATLLFLHTLSVAKAHYGQPDANNIQAEANAYRKALIAGTHGTKRYIPRTQSIPPAIRPTLIRFSGDGSNN